MLKVPYSSYDWELRDGTGIVLEVHKFGDRRLVRKVYKYDRRGDLAPRRWERFYRDACGASIWIPALPYAEKDE